MNCVIMGNLDGNLTKIGFDAASIRHILTLNGTETVLSHNDKDLFVKAGDRVCRVKGKFNSADPGPYFVVLNSWEVFSVREYQLLFDLEELPDNLLAGTDAAGRRHLCQRYVCQKEAVTQTNAPSLQNIDAKLPSDEISCQEMESLEEMVSKLKRGEFFEALTTEFSGKLKEIVQDLIDFRQDIQNKIEPNIVDIAAKDIPEASNQLEGINETLENSTMKIMDINEEQMEIANRRIADYQALIDAGGNAKEQQPWADKSLDIIREMKELLSGVSEEIQQIIVFLIPGIDQGMELISQGEAIEKVREILDEPIMTIREMVAEFGADDENISKLNAMNDELNDILENAQDSAPELENAAKLRLSPDEAMAVIEKQLEAFRQISSLSLNMSEPLSFQDLVGQRIQKVIKLVRSMETRIEDLIISFGIKLKKHREDPNQSIEDMNIEVEEYKAELKGPARDGEGLNQGDIDDLLASL